MSGGGEHFEPGREPEERLEAPGITFRQAVLTSDFAAIRGALENGANVDEIEEKTGLAALHLAVGLNDLEMTSFLIDQCGASFFPDRFGRWPTLIAAENRVDDALADYIVEKEAAYLAREQSGASGS